MSGRKSAAVAVFLMALGCGAASEGSLRLTVTARVLAHARATVIESPGALIVTAADVDRGYVDIAQPLRLAVRSNSPQGYLLDFAGLGESCRGLHVFGLGAPLRLGRQGGMVRQPAPGPGMASAELVLRLRCELAADAAPGVYGLSLQVTALPA